MTAVLEPNGCGSKSRTLKPVKRSAAFLSYYIGLALAVGMVFTLGREAEVWHFLFIPIYAIPIWWIAAGIGIRLGVYPSEFFRTVATAAGFLEPQSKRDELSSQD